MISKKFEKFLFKLVYLEHEFKQMENSTILLSSMEKKKKKILLSFQAYLILYS